MKNTNKPLLIIGPGSSISKLNKYDIKKYNTLTFSGDLMYFHNNNTYPDYYTFLDPYTLWWIYNNVKKEVYKKEWLDGLKQNTTLLYNDLLFKEFYQKGLSTEFGQNWLLGEFKNNIFPFICNLFKNIEEIKTEVIYDTFNQKEELYTKHNILIHSNTNLNTDKFSTFIIPLALYYFNPNEIFSIGFGDYESARFSATRSTDEYQGYKDSYNSVKNKLLNILKDLNINIKFFNSGSYYRELEWKTEKITFCIPSKSNLRYLKTCIPSIRKNASRNDHDIIVFVDSDEDGTIEWLEQVKDQYNLTYYVNPNLGKELFGIGKAYDYCIEKSTTDIFMIFHADMMLGKNADLNAYSHLKEKTVVCATRIEPPIHPNGGEKIQIDFGMWPEDWKEKEFDEYVESQLNETKTTNSIFAPWMMYKNEFLEIGGHDVIMHSCREDSDVFNRMKLAGFTFIQPWNSLVYHLTGRGAGSFGGDSARHEQWKKDMNNSTKEFIRKWGSNVKHTPLMDPIISKKYDIGFIVKNCNEQFLEALELWCSTIYVDCNRENYIQKEQPNTKFNLRDRILDINSYKYNNILIEFDAKLFTQQSYNIIQNLSDIITESGEIGEFELDCFKIKINDLTSYEKTLIKNLAF